MKGERRWIAFSIFSVALGAMAAAGPSEVWAGAPRQVPKKLDRAVRVELDYLLYLPQDYEQRESWPLVLFLHGAGERGDNLELVKKHGPPKHVEAGEDFPFILVSPQCPSDAWWNPVELAALVDEVEENCHVDPDRIYVTGLSMGGFGTWALAGYIPDRLAAIAPICGGGERIQARRIAHIPAWVFHGGRDPVVPIERSQEMVDALEKAGGTPKFTIYPEAAHDSWSETYARADFFGWLLQQKRGATGATKVRGATR